MKEGAFAAVTTLGILAVLSRWRGSSMWRKEGSRTNRRHRKRVSFSDADNSVIEVSLDLTDEERKALNWTRAELRQFSRAVAIEGWLEEWGS
eukprot:g11294.t1